MMAEQLTRLILSVMLLALSSLGLTAQEIIMPDEPGPLTPGKRNEVRLDLHAPMLYQALSLEYEYVVALDVDVGIMASAYLEEEQLNVLFFPTVDVMPYGRRYLGGFLLSMKKPNAGFFLEANSSIAYNDNLRNVHYEYSPETEKREKQIEGRHDVSWSIGLGGGLKLVTRSNWSDEVSCHPGRNTVKVSKWNAAYIYPAISVDYRFQWAFSFG